MTDRRLGHVGDALKVPPPAQRREGSGGYLRRVAEQQERLVQSVI